MLAQLASLAVIVLIVIALLKVLEPHIHFPLSRLIELEFQTLCGVISLLGFLVLSAFYLSGEAFGFVTLMVTPEQSRPELGRALHHKEIFLAFFILVELLGNFIVLVAIHGKK